MEAKIELHEKFKPLYTEQTRYFVVTSGRSGYKSFHVADFLLKLTYEPGHTILFTRWTMISANLSIIPEFIDKIERYGLEHVFHVTNNEIVNKLTGSRIVFRGIKTSQGTQTANLKSISGVTTFVVDEAEELTDYDVFEKIDLSIRDKSKLNRVIIVMNPSHKSHWVYTNYISTPRTDTTYIHTSYLDYPKVISESFLETAERTKTNNPLRYRHVFLGEWLDDADGIYWKRPMINRIRCEPRDQYARIVIGVDPATTATAQSDETGIIVGGRDKLGNGYVIADLSGRYSPNQWSKIVSDAYDQYGASCIVAEKNQGGDMVETVIRQNHKSARVKLVSATKGKAVRAEPIYALYEQNKVYHSGEFPILEQQMITFNPDSGQSPDRVDALVWMLTDMMLGANIGFS